MFKDYDVLPPPSKSFSSNVGLQESRNSYLINNPFKVITGFGFATPPSELKPGQVGICFEAFIAAPFVGPGGLGHGDGRGHNPNNEYLTARVTLWTVISTDDKNINYSQNNKIAPSVVGVDIKLGDGSIIKFPDVSIYRWDPSIGGSVSLPAFATTGVELSNMKAQKGEKDFGAGVDVTVSISNGGNGAQKLGLDLQKSYDPHKIILGKLIYALAPAGTIDGFATLRIKGKGTGYGDVKFVYGETRPFPSYAVYAYSLGLDGKTPIILERKIRDETPPVENLTKPMTAWY